MASFKKSPSLNTIKVRFVGLVINSNENRCYNSDQVTGCLTGNRGYFEAVKQLLPVHQLNNSLSHLTRNLTYTLFYKQHFYKKRQNEICKISSKN